MINNLSKEALEKLGIYELRNVARQVGVYSPTKYKKDVLIQKITSIVSGEQEPYVKKTNQGRPPKQIAGLDEILSIFVPNIEQKNQFEQRFHEKLFSPALMQSIKVLPDNFESFQGYLKVLPDNYGVVFRNGYFEGNKYTYYITPQMLGSIGLKEGDFLQGVCYYIDDTKPRIVKNIQFVNGVNLPMDQKVLREDFEQAEAIYPKNQIVIGNNKDSWLDFKCIDRICPIGEGSRVFINYEKNFEIEDFVVDLVKVFSDDYNVTLVAVDERPEDLTIIKTECDQLSMLNSHELLDEVAFAEQTLMIIKHLARQVEMGRNQILVIKNLQKYENLLTRYFVLDKKLSQEEAKIQSVQTIKKIFSLAKSTERGYALTIVAFNVLNQDIMDLCNCQIKMNMMGVDGSEVHLDCFNSYTLRPRTLLKPTAFDNLQHFKQGLNTQNEYEKLEELLNA